MGKKSLTDKEIARGILMIAEAAHSYRMNSRQAAEAAMANWMHLGREPLERVQRIAERVFGFTK